MTVSIDTIQRCVCAEFGVSRISLQSQRRAREIAWPRQVVYFLGKELTHHSFPTIGRLVGNRDHTSVMHGVKACAERIERLPAFAEQVRRVREAVIEADGPPDDFSTLLTVAAHRVTFRLVESVVSHETRGPERAGQSNQRSAT